MEVVRDPTTLMSAIAAVAAKRTNVVGVFIGGLLSLNCTLDSLVFLTDSVVTLKVSPGGSGSPMRRAARVCWRVKPAPGGLRATARNSSRSALLAGTTCSVDSKLADNQTS